jgi:hypothetical protein
MGCLCIYDPFISTENRYFHFHQRFIQTLHTFIMADLFESLKDEIFQGRKGILKKFDLVPKPETIRTEVRESLPLPAGESDFDSELKFLIDEEYILYKKYTETVVTRFLENTISYCKENPGEFPQLDQLTEALIQPTVINQNLIETFPELLGSAIRLLQVSLTAGSKPRAGGSLEKALEFLLQAHGLIKGLHFDTQVEILGEDKVILDFIFPADPEYWVTNPGFTVTTACMTTVNDRKRLAKSQVQKNTQRRLLCALGTEAHKEMVSALSLDALDDLQNNRIKVTVIGDVIHHWGKHSALSNYQSFIEELDAMKPLWNKWYQNEGRMFYENWANSKQNKSQSSLFQF